MEKTYNYSQTKVRSKIITALKRRKRESTAADIISTTTLPAVQVEEQIKEISSIYRGHVKVTESGELLYYFPNGFRQNKSAAFFSKAAAAVRKASALIFKIWTAVMLIGYAVLFTVLIIAAIVASIAASASGRGGSRSRGRGGGFLISRIIGLLVRIWFWRSITTPSYGYSRSRNFNKPQKPKGKPLYQIVFSFLFGDSEAVPDWEEAEEKELIRYIQKLKGIVTVEEVMALTGKSSQDAEQLLHKFCVYYNGEPKASFNGSVYYQYPELMKTTSQTDSDVSVPERKPMKKFSENKSSTNIKVGLINVFNIALSSYFLYYSLIVVSPLKTDTFGFLYNLLYKNPVNISPTLIAIVLGIIPAVYSVLFFLVPIFRKLSMKKENKKRAEGNYRKKLYSYILANPRNVQTAFLPSPDDKGFLPGWEKTRGKILVRMGDAADIDISGKEGMESYDYPEIERKNRDVEDIRKSVRIEGLGDVIFSSE